MVTVLFLIRHFRLGEPGEKISWERSESEGLVLVPFTGDTEVGHSVSYDDARKALTEIGYDAPLGDHAEALLAFQLRFCPESLGQGFGRRTKAALMVVWRK